MTNWKHVFKLDPAKYISDEHLKRICTSGTDAVIVGGTDNVTFENVVDLFMRIQSYSLPCILEVSTLDAITIGFDYYFIPMVLNSREKKWMMDLHHEAIKQYRSLMDFENIVMEGYCILNEQAKAFKKTSCQRLEDEDVLAYAYMAERIFKLPIFYLEYSGVYGRPELVHQVKQELDQTLLFYGGGISSREQAEEMYAFADVIVVGNVIYTNIEQALQTVPQKR